MADWTETVVEHTPIAAPAGDDGLELAQSAARVWLRVALAVLASGVSVVLAIAYDVPWAVAFGLLPAWLLLVWVVHGRKGASSSDLASGSGRTIVHHVASDGPVSLARRVQNPPQPILQRPRVTIRGRVQTRESITSLISETPCLACRIVGECAGGPIDDAYGTQFEVHASDGRVAVVDARVATIDLPLPTGSEEIVGTPRLLGYLERRGFLRVRVVRAAEAILRNGDTVEVEGTYRTERRAGGFRTLGEAFMLEDWPGSPLIVRRRD